MTITISSPEDLLAGLPFHIGFHPHDSLVVVILRDRRLSFVARFDLPRRQEDVTALAALSVEQIAHGAERVGGDGAMLVSYDDSALAWATLLEVGDRLVRVGLPTVLSALVANQRWRRLGSSEPGHWDCWRAIPPAAQSPVAAEYVGRGHVAAPDRPAAIACLRPQPVMESSSLTVRQVKVPVLARTHWRSFFQFAQPDEPDPWRPEPAAILRLGRSLLDRDFRDALIAVLVPGTIPLANLCPSALARAQDVVGSAQDQPATPSGEPPWHPQTWQAGRAEAIFARFAQLARSLPMQLSPGPYCVCALLAGRLGRGHLAGAAVEQALIADPQHVLAGLLEQLLDCGVLPGHPVSGADSGIPAA